MNASLAKLGLQLERRKAPLETLFIDHLEKNPTDNFTPQAAAAPAPQPASEFEVASVKPCDARSLPPGARSGAITRSPGRLMMECVTLHSLIATAYVDYADGKRQGPASLQRMPIEGGPSWITSEHYTVDAKSDGPASLEMTQGPMLQALLEDRFQVKTHRVVREVPVYEMTLAKGGLKLAHSEEGSCVQRDLSKGQQVRPGARRKTLLRSVGVQGAGA
jgi:uncharacterized protein (TIGR03435 family)